jgi:hypothetical protein
MMLTDYETFPRPTTEVRSQRGRKKEAPVKDGERAKAEKFFNGLEAKDELLKTTVLLSSLQGFGSGVILGVDGTKAYILTAKHNLFILAGQLKPEDKTTKAFKKPSDYVLTDFSGGISIGYRPAALLQPPEDPPRTVTVQVTGFSFAGVAGSGDDWIYDAMLFECTNPDFYTFVNTNRFIKKANYAGYKSSLALNKSKRKYQLLDRSQFQFIQLGYGEAKPKDMDIEKENYTSYPKRIQCKQSVPVAATPVPGIVYEPRAKETDRSKWRSMSHAIELQAGNTKSTGPGDSGGPLFAVKGNKFALVGVTSGANFYSDETRLTNPPSDRVIQNNLATYWHEIFKGCAFLDRE